MIVVSNTIFKDSISAKMWLTLFCKKRMNSRSTPFPRLTPTGGCYLTA